MADVLFSERDLRWVFENQIERARQEINLFSEDYILGVSETDLVEHLVQEYKVHPPRLGEPFIAESGEVDVDVRGYPGYASGDDDTPVLVRGYRVEIHVAFTGIFDLFRYQPSRYSGSPPRAEIRPNYLVFAYQEPGVIRGEQVKDRINGSLDDVRNYLKWMEEDCARFNADLERNFRQIVAAKRERVLGNRQGLVNIGLPMKRRQDVAKTYAIPDVQRRAQIQKPVLKENLFVPEPALAQEEYEHILTVIGSWAMSVERSPDAFRNMREEDLRWHILVMLNSHYEGRATGETFNYHGKTDILIREGDRNAFIAECAFLGWPSIPNPEDRSDSRSTALARH
ncbi:MAG: hypothetical protein FJ279_08470 [Planctomycetes bacterium]|nr:hypothetical protein [Planctomycetota bacterium]